MWQGERDAIAICSSGLSISHEAKLELEVELKKITQGQGAGSASARIEKALEGIVFTPEDLKNPNVIEAQRIYSKWIIDYLKIKG